MSLFSCRKCNCVENTALSNFWYNSFYGKQILCSECDPEINKWHDEFPKRSAAGMLVDQSGHLWGSAEQVPKHYQIVGQVHIT